MKKALFLYLIVFLEGYAVLSSELIAIRLIIPFVGGATNTTSIVIAAVLLPLAFGYYVGGNFKANKISIRKKLLRNIFISTVILTFGLSYVILHDFFQILLFMPHVGFLTATAIYSGIFLVLPVFLLAQTIPLVMNYFSSHNLSLITGKMLFFSTLGSLMGAVFATLFLMTTVGVHMTASITILCLCFLHFIISKKKLSKANLIILIIACLSIFMNKPSMLKRADIIESNVYNTIQLYDYGNGLKVMSLNNANSAGINTKSGELPFDYMKYIENNYIKPIELQGPVRSILVIGAGGFTLGLNDKKNDYTFVDIDKSLKDISEQYFLNAKLGENKKFEGSPARGFINQAIKNKLKYDFIVVDTYSGAQIPEHLVTQEFFVSLKNILNENGIIVFNIITTANFRDSFSVNIDTTLRSVFPFISRQIVSPYNAWNITNMAYINTVYTYFDRKDFNPAIYTDDKNRSYFDKGRPLKE